MKDQNKLKSKNTFVSGGFNNIVKNHPDGIIIIDSKGEILYVNQAAETMFGHKANDLVGELFGVPLIQDDFFEIDIVRRDGLPGTGEIRVGGFDCDEVNARLVSIRDITVRKKMAEELEEAKNKAEELRIKAEESNRLKSTFISIMSHELRSPLNAIIGFGSLIDRASPGDKISHYSQCIKNSGEHLLGIIQDLLDISMLQAGKIKCRKETFQLESVFNDIHETLKVQQKLDGKEHLNISFKPSKKYNKLVIRSDQQKIKQIMINLLRNALKFTQKGFIEYGYEMEKLRNTSYLKIFVKDSGVGIPKDKQEIIFNQFQQVENKSMPGSKGVGLGLAIVKELIDLFGGRIMVHSELEEGTRFDIIIPCEILSLPIQNHVEMFGLSKNYDFT